MSPRLKTAGGTVVLSVLIAAILLAGGPGGGGGEPTPTPTVTPTATPGDGTANVWAIAGSAGSGCARSGTAAAYSSATDCSLSAATSAASSGDVIGLKSGTFAGPVTWGDGTKTLEYIGEDGTVVDVGTAKPNYSGFNFNNKATVTNVDIGGDYPIVGLFCSDCTWQDSTFRTADVQRDCGADEPTMIGDTEATSSYANVNVKVLRNTFQAQHANGANQGSCGSSDGVHYENIRIDKASSDVLIEGNRFESCDDGDGYIGCGSGQIFITTPTPGALPPKNIVIRNNWFGSTPNNAMQWHPNVSSCVGWVIAYNSSDSDFVNRRAGTSNACASGNTGSMMIGNAVPNAFGTNTITCMTGWTYVKNVWEAGSGTPCGSDQRTTNLQLDSDLVPQSGSPAINGGETPGASDYCTGDLGSIDILGNPRPFGATGNCDAGAYEVG